MSSERSELAEVLSADLRVAGVEVGSVSGEQFRQVAADRLIRSGWVNLAHLADVLGSDETRESVAERLSVREMTQWQPDAHEDHNRWSWRGDGHGAAMRDGFRTEADAALAAVREVLGLPGGGA